MSSTKIKDEVVLAREVKQCHQAYSYCGMRKVPNSRCDFNLAKCLVDARLLYRDGLEIRLLLDRDATIHTIKETPGYS